MIGQPGDLVDPAEGGHHETLQGTGTARGGVCLRCHGVDVRLAVSKPGVESFGASAHEMFASQLPVSAPRILEVTG
jgi:hypothetical protein